MTEVALCNGLIGEEVMLCARAPVARRWDEVAPSAVARDLKCELNVCDNEYSSSATLGRYIHVVMSEAQMLIAPVMETTARPM
jgi:hypothetical protein